MDILFQDHKLEKLFNNDSLLFRKYGTECAKLLKRRLDELRAADNLEILRSLSRARCHELKGDRAGTLAVDAKNPYRLIFEPAHEPVPRKPDGGLDWAQVTIVRVLSVEDYHG